MFALVVRFYLRDEAAAAGFDKLVEETASKVKTEEPDTLIYAVHKVEDAPLSRIFYELYSSRAAFDRHGEYAHTQRFLAERDRYITDLRIEFLDSPTGKGC